MLGGFGYFLYSPSCVLPQVTPVPGPLCSAGRRPLSGNTLKGRQPNLLQMTLCSQDPVLTTPYGFLFIFFLVLASEESVNFLI